MEEENIDEIIRCGEIAKIIWNNSADGYNQWDTLCLEEKLRLILMQL